MVFDDTDHDGKASSDLEQLQFTLRKTNTAVTAQHERILVLEQHSKDLERTVYDVKHLVKELINSQSQQSNNPLRRKKSVQRKKSNSDHPVQLKVEQSSGSDETVSTYTTLQGDGRTPTSQTWDGTGLQFMQDLADNENSGALARLRDHVTTQRRTSQSMPDVRQNANILERLSPGELDLSTETSVTSEDMSTFGFGEGDNWSDTRSPEEYRLASLAID